MAFRKGVGDRASSHNFGRCSVIDVKPEIQLAYEQYAFAPQIQSTFGTEMFLRLSQQSSGLTTFVTKFFLLAAASIMCIYTYMKLGTNAEIGSALKEASTPCPCQKALGAVRAIARFYDWHLAGIGMAPTQFNLLMAIRVTGLISLTRLASRLGLERNSLIRGFGALQRAGWAGAKARGCARQRLHFLTQTGQSTLQEAMSRWNRAQQLYETGPFDELYIPNHQPHSESPRDRRQTWIQKPASTGSCQGTCSRGHSWSRGSQDKTRARCIRPSGS
jgi:hypothetical protein